MRIGVPAESRPGETRVAATPETVKKLAAQHEVVVQSGAGVHAAAIDDAYVAAGARIVTAAEAFGADLVLKVRSPDAAERAQMKPGRWPAGVRAHGGERAIGPASGVLSSRPRPLPLPRPGPARG